MRSHQTILKEAGPDAAVAEALGVKPFNVRDWRLRQSIPAERWKQIVDLGWTSYEELAAAVAKSIAANDAAPAKGKAA